MHVVLIGATGLVGSYTLGQLIADKQVTQLTVLSRRSTNLQSTKLNEIITTELTPDFLRKLDLNADAFICALGTTIKKAKSKAAFRAIDFELVLAFAKLAERTKAKSLVVISALGAKKNSKIFYNKTKGEMQSEVNKLKIPSIYMLHPSLIIGHRSEKRFAEEMAIRVYSFMKKLISEHALSKIGTPVESIARVAVVKSFEQKPGRHTIKNFMV